MVTCAICEHAKIEAINAKLLMGVAPGIIARRYRLDPLAFGLHVAHRTHTAEVSTLHTNTSSLAGILIPAHARHVSPVTENPFSQFKQAWQLAKDDPRMRAQMLSWLNDTLRDDDEVLL